MVGLIVIGGFSAFIIATALFTLWMDKYLRGVDKEKYFVKSVTKQFKKGKITVEEYHKATVRE